MTSLLFLAICTAFSFVTPCHATSVHRPSSDGSRSSDSYTGQDKWVENILELLARVETLSSNDEFPYDTDKYSSYSEQSSSYQGDDPYRDNDAKTVLVKSESESATPCDYTWVARPYPYCGNAEIILLVKSERERSSDSYKANTNSSNDEFSSGAETCSNSSTYSEAIDHSETLDHYDNAMNLLESDSKHYHHDRVFLSDLSPLSKWMNWSMSLRRTRTRRCLS